MAPAPSTFTVNGDRGGSSCISHSADPALRFGRAARSVESPSGPRALIGERRRRHTIWLLHSSLPLVGRLSRGTSRRDNGLASSGGANHSRRARRAAHPDPRPGAPRGPTVAPPHRGAIPRPSARSGRAGIELCRHPIFRLEPELHHVELEPSNRGKDRLPARSMWRVKELDGALLLQLEQALVKLLVPRRIRVAQPREVLRQEARNALELHERPSADGVTDGELARVDSPITSPANASSSSSRSRANSRCE